MLSASVGARLMRIRCNCGRSAVVVLLVLSVCGAVAVGEPVVFARHLALSPNGETLAFSWAGDIWAVSSEGGAARRLTVNPAYDSHPV